MNGCGFRGRPAISLQHVGKVPRPFLPAPRACAACVGQPIGGTAVPHPHPGFAAIVLHALACPGLLPAQLRTLGSASLALALWTRGFYSVLVALPGQALTRLKPWDAQFLHCFNRNCALAPALPTPNRHTRLLASALGKTDWTTRGKGRLRDQQRGGGETSAASTLTSPPDAKDWALWVAHARLCMVIVCFLVCLTHWTVGSARAGLCLTGGWMPTARLMPVHLHKARVRSFRGLKFCRLYFLKHFSSQWLLWGTVCFCLVNSKQELVD